MRRVLQVAIHKTTELLLIPEGGGENAEMILGAAGKIACATGRSRESPMFTGESLQQISLSHPTAHLGVLTLPAPFRGFGYRY
jgi:hypothetical protein